MARRLKNSKGFSLPELMISMGISMVVALIASVAFMLAYDTYLRSIRRYEAETEMLSLMLALRSSFATAVNVEYGGRASAANNADTNRPLADFRVGAGRLYTITDAQVPNDGTGTRYDGNDATAAGALDDRFMVAMFNREAAGVSRLQSRLRGIQIVYQRPNVTGNSVGTATNPAILYPSSGAVYIDSEWAGAEGWAGMSPRNSSQMFTRLTNFEINNVKVLDVTLAGNSYGSIQNVVATGGTPCAAGTNSCIGYPVLSAEVTMVMRYFTTGTARQWRWCNSTRFFVNPGGCQTAGPTGTSGIMYYDVSRRMNPVFLNNVMHPLNTAADMQYLPRRSAGNIHFMVPWLPLGGRIAW